MSKYFKSLNLKSGVMLGLAGAVIIASVGLTVTSSQGATYGSPESSSVMITNRKGNSGGTGIILNSSRSESQILTNKHVCGVVENGGVVRTRSSNYQVVSYLTSDRSDLCLLTVAADLKINTKVAQQPPAVYSSAHISGHPRLLPNVITHGHVSDKRIIEVFTGIRACTEEEAGGQLGLLCMIFGGMPVIESYESTLVTATIQPGSSGSGIYNDNNELIGVVFAGSGDLGYAWTVPYEQVTNFLYKDHMKLKSSLINREINIAELLGASKARNWRETVREVQKKCDAGFDTKFAKACELLKADDMIWVE